MDLPFQTERARSLRVGNILNWLEFELTWFIPSSKLLLNFRLGVLAGICSTLPLPIQTQLTTRQPQCIIATDQTDPQLGKVPL
jgi:hypothetical protein